MEQLTRSILFTVVAIAKQLFFEICVILINSVKIQKFSINFVKYHKPINDEKRRKMKIQESTASRELKYLNKPAICCISKELAIN
ncbi:hypothetical protein I8751_15010 [Nostocaceae cyanobacterium CENA357]|uniref:Uncharacterized protein n=1 Tax=Atlanticothrix silvestris CENA357 TaxID=1725252 RepID=A0A8J7HJC6_9CYAN|nr:hypothetical protein [Atlanticothrix silvestris]MBH8553656.1 hypothetical protein [Atlanticothrix silvestris CENA357]